MVTDLVEKKEKKDKKIPKEISQEIIKKVFGNVLKAIGIMFYFIVLNLAHSAMQQERLVGDIEVFAGAFLVAGLLFLEKAYKEDSGTIAITGIEFLVLSLHSLSIMHIITLFKYDFRFYLLTSSYVFSIYYVLKAILLYTKGRKDYLNSLSDIAEIVKKDEPIKKEAKKETKKRKKKMIKSMTGYGKAVLSQNQREYQVEIKSVNHRYLDICVKMPRMLSYLEEEVKKEIASKVKRGKIDVFITFENNSSEGKEIKINTEIAKIYIDELKKLAKQEDISANIEVTEISKFPDVLSIQNNQEDETIKLELTQTVSQAADKLVQMRAVEGNKMAEDLQGRIKNIQEKVKEISSLSTGLIEEYVVKLEGRIKEILKNQEVDQARLAQEVVIYADKCSVEEEVTRLKSHISQFEKLLNVEDAIGKKLDFIIQEMNRETNTIGSKANNLEITNDVIDVKTELENIREQIQNIE